MLVLRARVPTLVLFAVLLLALGRPVPSAHAAAITVTTSDDELNADGDCSLREAIEAATTQADVGGCDFTGDFEIRFAVSTNGDPIDLVGSGLTVGVVPGTLRIVGNGPSRTIIDGGDAVRPITTTSRLAIVGVTIRDGNAGGGDGGAILDTGILLSVTDSVLSNNAARDGGAIHSSAIVTITNTVVEDNQASRNGGGVFAGQDSDLTVDDSTIDDNTAGRHGGGIFTESFVELTITSSALTRNDATNNGGGIYMEAPASKFAISDSTISENTAGGFGGGIFRPTATPLNIARSTISGNSANLNGGGLHVNGGSTVTITNSTFSGNTADVDGGGISSFNGSTVNATNVTFSGNSAADDAGGIFNDTGSTVNLRATVFEAGSDGDNCDGDGTTNSQGSNVADDDSCFPNAGSDKVVADVRLGPLADNGGPTATHALLANSPAIDAVVGGCTVTEDQRGFGRPVDGDNNGSAICDSGAYEFGAKAPGGSDGPADAENKPNNDDDDEKAKDKKETEEQRQQRERTNRSNRDDYFLEGNVVGICETEAAPPCVIVANRDGAVRVVLLKEAAQAFGSIRVGDYLEADGEKVHELLFEAGSVKVTRPRRGR